MDAERPIRAPFLADDTATVQGANLRVENFCPDTGQFDSAGISCLIRSTPFVIAPGFDTVLFAQAANGTQALAGFLGNFPHGQASIG